MRLPLWYFFTAGVFICYGWFSILSQEFSSDVVFLHQMNIVNLYVTLSWVLFNLCIAGYGLYQKVSGLELAVPFYYFFLNVANTFVIYMTILKGVWAIPFVYFFVVALVTKSAETVVIPWIIVSRLRRQQKA